MFNLVINVIHTVYVEPQRKINKHFMGMRMHRQGIRGPVGMSGNLWGFLWDSRTGYIGPVSGL